MAESRRLAQSFLAVAVAGRPCHELTDDNFEELVRTLRISGLLLHRPGVDTVRTIARMGQGLSGAERQGQAG